MNTKDAYLGDRDENLQLSDWENFPRIELYMDQLVFILQAEMRGLWVQEEDGKVSASRVNNYVKVKLVPPPRKKRYERQHISALLMVFVLKSVLSMQELSLLLPKLVEEFSGDWAGLHQCFVTHLRRAIEQSELTASHPEAAYEQVLMHAVMAFSERLRAEQILARLSSEEATTP